MIIHSKDLTDRSQLGGKGKSLAKIQDVYPNIPSWFAITPSTKLCHKDIIHHCNSLKSELFAVRSSAAQEDGKEHSFAGQFSTKLFVSLDEVISAIEEVRSSNQSSHLETYAKSKEIDEVSAPTIIVQEMLNPISSGVAFSKNPIARDKDTVIVSSVWGVGSALVSGEVDSDNWEIRDKKITSEKIAKKLHFHCPDSSAAEGTAMKYLPTKKQNQPSLTNNEILQVANLALLCEDHFGCPQDIEWAFQDEVLHLLQSRPITTIGEQNQDLIVWDNSNIAESYSGITSPLTFTFAQRAYENVYREFCKMLSVPESRITTHDHVFGTMLGHIEGHVFYNLNSWYQVLALLPGFSVNREYMEQMMGVKEPIPNEIVDKIITNSKVSKFSDTLSLIKTLRGLVNSHRNLPKMIEEFYQRLNRSLDLNGRKLEEMNPKELVEHYHELEANLLTKWDAPLINDFLAMIYYGILGKLSSKWANDPTLQNSLLLDCGEIISAEPPKLMQEMASILRSNKSTLQLINKENNKLELLLSLPEFKKQYDYYIEKFGDRCMEELKLESKTLVDQPEALIDSIIALANSDRKHTPPKTQATPIPQLSPLKK